MPFTVSYSKKFAEEFQNYPSDQKLAVYKFVSIFEIYGLVDFNKFDGKIGPSWKNVDESDDQYHHAVSNSLWHYHIGIPNYKPSISGKYQTSDWLLHFQWNGNKGAKGHHIMLVDTYKHHDSDRNFYLPSADYLTISDSE